MPLSTLHTSSRDNYEQIVVSITGEIFFSSVQDGVFNLLSSFTDLEEFGRLHGMIDSNKPNKAH